MTTSASRDDIAKSLRLFKNRRDELLHGDVNAFEHNLERFLSALTNDSILKNVIESTPSDEPINVEEWWQTATQGTPHLGSPHPPSLAFPANDDQEFIFRYKLLEYVHANPRAIFQFGSSRGVRKIDEGKTLFLNLIADGFVKEFGQRLAESANMTSREARDLQAVPLNRIPRPDETRIFLSHKTVDKPMVRLYFNALKQVGFDPWMDETDMPTGTLLERGILKGFEASCAAVFFITENFKDESYLASEIDYAIGQRRLKGNKFSIITLRYPNSAPVPGLLRPYIYNDVKSDIEGFQEIVRGLPIELGPVLWTKDVVA